MSAYDVTKIFESIRGKNQVVIKDLTIKDVHFATQEKTYDESGSRYLLHFNPEMKYSTHYAYKLENIRFERVWDFGNEGVAIGFEP